ncbi:MAG: hypothetical protein WC693_04860 [Patescibacteria group bacterium]|jgi:hypothetical protein
MKGSTNYIHIILTLSIAMIMITLIAGLAYGIFWYFNTYVGGDLDPSNNIITACIGKCQEEQICSAGTSSNYRLVNGECQCSCIKIKSASNINVTANTNVQNEERQLYEHQKFTVQYPSGWEMHTDISGSDLALETVTFSSPEVEGDNIWSVLLYSTASTEMDELIAKMGSQFSDRREIRERITVAGKQATRATVTTDTITGWRHVQIFFEDGDTLYAINDGASRNLEFETFYNSFQLKNN